MWSRKPWRPHSFTISAHLYSHLRVDCCDRPMDSVEYFQQQEKRNFRPGLMDHGSILCSSSIWQEEQLPTWPLLMLWLALGLNVRRLFSSADSSVVVLLLNGFCSSYPTRVIYHAARLHWMACKDLTSRRLSVAVLYSPHSLVGIVKSLTVLFTRPGLVSKALLKLSNSVETVTCF